MLAATFWFDAGGPFELMARLASILLALVGLLGLIRFLYVFLYASGPIRGSSSSLPDTAPAGLADAKNARAALPSRQSIPLSDYPRRATTKELAHPRSVTENTTKLLDE
jgi:hypothetical protein